MQDFHTFLPRKVWKRMCGHTATISVIINNSQEREAVFNCVWKKVWKFRKWLHLSSPEDNSWPGFGCSSLNASVSMRGAYLAALLLPEDGRWGVSCGAALKGDATPLGGKLISGLGGNLRWNWKRRTEHEYRGEGGCRRMSRLLALKSVPLLLCSLFYFLT